MGFYSHYLFAIFAFTAVFSVFSTRKNLTFWFLWYRFCTQLDKRLFVFFAWVVSVFLELLTLFLHFMYERTENNAFLFF